MTKSLAQAHICSTMIDLILSWQLTIGAEQGVEVGKQRAAMWGCQQVPLLQSPLASPTLLVPIRAKARKALRSLGSQIWPWGGQLLTSTAARPALPVFWAVSAFVQENSSSQEQLCLDPLGKLESPAKWMKALPTQPPPSSPMLPTVSF